MLQRGNVYLVPLNTISISGIFCFSFCPHFPCAGPTLYITRHKEVPSPFPAIGCTSCMRGRIFIFNAHLNGDIPLPVSLTGFGSFLIFCRLFYSFLSVLSSSGDPESIHFDLPLLNQASTDERRLHERVSFSH